MEAFVMGNIVGLYDDLKLILICTINLEWTNNDEHKSDLCGQKHSDKHIHVLGFHELLDHSPSIVVADF